MSDAELDAERRRLLHQGESIHSIQGEQRPMAPLDILRFRLKAVASMDLPPAPPGPWRYGVTAPYWYHPREWAEGYVAAAKDFLKVVGEG
jgi:hypothetical protein